MLPSIEETKPPLASFPIAPFPKLQEPIREEIRAATCRYYRKLPFVSVTGSRAPLPYAPSPGEQNPWLILIDRLEADATITRTIKPPLKKSSLPTRSTFRKGTLTIDEQGLTLQGIGTRPIAWMQQVGCWGFVLFFVFGFLGSLVGSPSIREILQLLSGGSIVVGFLGGGVASAIGEMRRGPQEASISWEDLIEVQFEPEMLWAIFIYTGPMVRIGEAGAPLFFSLNRMTPAITESLWNTIAHYAPGKIRADAAGYSWTPQRRLLAAIFLGLLLDLVLFLTYLMRNL